MKKLLIAFLLMISSYSAFSDTLSCDVWNSFREDSSVMEAEVGIEIKTVAFCNNSKYRVTLHGAGLGIYMSAVDAFALYCPFQTVLEGSYYGLSAKAALLLGLGVGVFASKGGFCIITRVSGASFGASVEGAYLKVEKTLLY